MIEQRIGKVRKWIKTQRRANASKTILARLPKRRYESVITSLNGKIGTKGFDDLDFIAEIIGHYEMLMEPFKNRQNREN
jgi:hypothetical protein